MSITIGILASFWIDYGTHYVGGTRCSPDIPYTGGTSASPSFDPYTDVGPDGCTGQSSASWRIPLALQILPALILGIGMIFYPDTPRWLLLQERDEEAFRALSKLRRVPADHPNIVSEALDIKASILLENTYTRDHYNGASGLKLHAAQVNTSPAFPHLERNRELTDDGNSISRSSQTNPGSAASQSVAALCSSNNLWYALFPYQFPVCFY